jgi:hypothetical protein
MISVLLPSRGRPGPLADSVASLRDRADDPHQIEVLVAADEDDPATIDTARTLGAVTAVSPRHGYTQMHLYINALAGQANGDWLLLWNDDARMLTPGWDTRVYMAPKAAVLWPSTNNGPHLNVFPLVARRMVEILGHFSLASHCDSWVQDVAHAAGLQRRIGVDILHDRCDLTGGHNDQTWRESQAGYRTGAYHSPEMVDLRCRDVEILCRSWAS